MNLCTEVAVPHLFGGAGLIDNVPYGMFLGRLHSVKSVFFCRTSFMLHGARRPLAHVTVPLVPVRLGRLSRNPRANFQIMN
jgi:hypothetical protein